MRRDENWAIDIDRVRAFFRRQPDVREQEDGFIFGSCRIVLVPRTGSALGKWQIPRTQIVFDGDADDTETIYHRFFLQFLSAGG